MLPIGPKLYIIGGKINSLKSTNQINCFDLQNNLWEEFKCQSDSQSLCINSHSAAILEQTDNQPIIVIFGGFIETGKNYGCTNALYTLDTNKKVWNQLKVENGKLPKPRYNSSIQIIKDKLYMFGGTDLEQKFGDLWQFDFKANQWTEIKYQGANNPDSRKGHSLLKYEDRFLILYGGLHDITHERNDIFMFDLNKNEWTFCDKEIVQDSEIPFNENKQQKNIERRHTSKSPKQDSQLKILPKKSKLPDKKYSEQSFLPSLSRSFKKYSPLQLQSQMEYSAQTRVKTDISTYETQTSKQVQQQQTLQKSHLLSEFYMSKDEQQSLIDNSLLCTQMNQSIQTIGNQHTKKSKEMRKKVGQTFQKRRQTMNYQLTRIVGKRPSARDGHSFTSINENLFVVFGGDRHMMQYNDIYIFDAAQINIFNGKK